MHPRQNLENLWFARINRGQELVIGGYVPGNPIDSIIVGYYQDGTLLYAGKVRNGFVPHTRRAVATKLGD